MASGKDLDMYQRTSGGLRRLLESVGLNEGRKTRNVTLRITLRPRDEEAQATGQPIPNYHIGHRL
jgi:hypothetical protein